MRSISRIAVVVACLCALPLVAVAQEEEPYSGGDVPETTLPSQIDVVVEGLTVTLSVSGAGDCSWDLGDGSTADGNPVSHTYAEAGRYDVTATCDGDTYTVQVAVGDLPGTGTEATTYVLWGGGLIALGGLAVATSRRIRS